jgi:hypothetical protein
MSPSANFAAWLASHGYNSRKSDHGDAVAEVLLEDLLAHCRHLTAHAASGEVVYEQKVEIHSGQGGGWNIDLVIGEAAGAPTPPPPGVPIKRERPSTIRIAVEVKAIMTAHSANRLNRRRDMEAMHEHVHNYDPRAIAAGIIVANIATKFSSSLRGGAVTTHRKPEVRVQKIVEVMRQIPVRTAPVGVGMEAMCVLVVDYENVTGAPASIHATKPAPQVGDPLHWDAFVQRVCQQYRQRWP